MTPNKSTLKKAQASVKPLAPEQFTRAVVAVLTPLANPSVRPWMRAYLKDQFDFLGIKTPARRAAVAALIRAKETRPPQTCFAAHALFGRCLNGSTNMLPSICSPVMYDSSPQRISPRCSHS